MKMVHRIKMLARPPLVALAFRGMTKCVIASTGRAGSTMLFGAVTEAVVRTRYGAIQETIIGRQLRRLGAGYLERLTDLPNTPYVICKTHDQCHDIPATGFRCVFVYGDPLASAQSVEQVVARNGKHWFHLHQSHLRASGRYEDLYQEDVLNYEGQMRSWLTSTNQNIICIDYDDLWDSEGLLSSFLGYDIHLPQRWARSPKALVPNANNELFGRLRSESRRLKALYQARVIAV